MNIFLKMKRCFVKYGGRAGTIENRLLLQTVKCIMVVCALGAGGAFAQQSDMETRLESSLQELAAAREAIANEKLPMVKGLNAIEDELMEIRLEHQKIMRQLDSRNLDLNNLRSEIKSRQGEKNYVSNLLSEYIRNFQTRLHIAEIDLYAGMLEAAVLAPDNSNLSDEEIFVQQTALVEASIKRLQEAVGGVSFDGNATGEDGLVREGRFLMVGPVALFTADEQGLSGIAEQRLGSLEPTVMPFADTANAELVRQTVTGGSGIFPFDPSLGNARKIEETRETLSEHLKKGGFVVYPIVGMFILAVLVAIGKWIQLSLIPMPSEKDVQPLLKDMLHNRHDQALKKAAALKGPTATMLKVGLEHIDEPKDLVEEVMYEEMLTTRLRVDKWTSFIAVCASSAPLLGLLGTVTGIINTFKLITVFGSGDVKTLSGGISEALITTELGLVVAIFSLVLHAFLSRKARRICDRMEQIAILFMNRATRTAPDQTVSAVPESIVAEPAPA